MSDHSSSNHEIERQIDSHSLSLTFFADHHIVLVIAVVGVAHASIGFELEFHEFVAESAFVAHAARYSIGLIGSLARES